MVEIKPIVAMILRRPFKTPLFEVSAEIDFSTDSLVEFPARTLHKAFSDEYPQIERLPVFLVAPSPLPANQNLHVAAYRFYDSEGKRVVQVGPRMIAFNTLTWLPGYEDYRTSAERVMRKYAEINPTELVIRYSVGFYNRIPVSDLAEARDILIPLSDVVEDTTFDDFFSQLVRKVAVGSVLSQVATSPGDERTREPFLAVNNIVRREVHPFTTLIEALEDWVLWIDQAHDTAKQVFWNLLTEPARQSWRESGEDIGR